MEFRILGPVEVRQRGEPVPLGGPKQRALLAVLVMNANHVVAVPKLISALWDEPPETVTSQIQQLVSQLRRALGDRVSRRPRIQFRSPGYVLRVEPSESDLASFEDRAADGRAALAAGHHADAATLLRTALKPWRGPALGDAAEPIVRTERPRLDERRLAVVEDRIIADLALGRHSQLIGELTGLVTEHPLRESLRGHLMLALYRSGRQADALHLYHRGRRVLRDELGLDPSAQLQQLEQRILHSDPDLAQLASADSPPFSAVLPTSPSPRSPCQLPLDIADFTGRDQQAAELGRLISRESGKPAASTVVAAIAGPGGIGKTALAVHCAHRLRSEFPDGQLYVDLRGAGQSPLEPAAVLERFLRALGVDGGGIPDELAECATIYRDLVADRRVLVVLDNAASERQIRPLLPGSPSCAALITSRTRLGALEGAHHIELDVLQEQAAADLLTRVVGPARVAEDVPAAKEIADLCGHLPLALRIAAARLAARPHWSLSRLVDRLSDERRRLDELVAGDLAVRTSLATSYQGLTGKAQRMFQLLGCLDLPDFTSSVAGALLDTPADIADDLVETLADARLLHPSRNDETGQLRYRFHDLVRLYARDLADAELDGSDRLEAIQRGFHYYLGTTRNAADVLSPATEDRSSIGILAGELRSSGSTFAARAVAAAWVDAEVANLLAVANQAISDPEHHPIVVGLSAAAAGPLNVRHRQRTLIELARLAIDAARTTGDERGLAQATNDLAIGYMNTGQVEAALEHAEQAMRYWTLNRDPISQAATLNIIGNLWSQHGDPNLALDNYRQALDIRRRLGHREAQAAILSNLAETLAQEGQCEEALEHLDEALNLYRSEKSVGGEGLVLGTIGKTQLHAGDPARAIDSFERALPLVCLAGQRHFEADFRWHLGTAHHAVGNHEQARASKRQALEILRNTDGLAANRAVR
ncbi:AfsR/SARP family transcriptional regulator [Actinopolymorpha alba]|uniref:AfsR/SARP family transcriptional regulator n=1 Tax=Actinopolymorpha alba TaxID=533267 RepID=UPI0003716CAF|nr:BTAD domain-containing putative transcriptional regulator [Actinopolymorpha alba]